MDSLTKKTLETKNIHRFWTSTAKVSKGHVQHHVTLSLKVIRKGHAFMTSWNGFPDQKNIRIEDTQKFSMGVILTPLV